MRTKHFEFIQAEATGYQLERLIAQYGIPVSNRYAGKGRISFDVPAAQAKWAAYIFQCAGIAPIGTEGAPDLATRALPTAWGVGLRRPDITTRWVDFLGGLLGAPRRQQWEAKTKGCKR